jgi:hypothetical protein
MFINYVMFKERLIDVDIHVDVCLFVFLALKPIVVVFSQPSSGL